MNLPTAICSQCGYDLRGIGSERCPECGFELALQPALTGEIPWTYRRPRGRVRAFADTTWKVTRGGPWISRVTAGPVSMRDARRFWLVAATIIALPVMLLIAYAQLRLSDAWVYLYAPDPLLMGTGPNAAEVFGLRSPVYMNWPGWVHSNLLWPIAAALEVPGVAIIAAWLFVVLATGVPTYLFHLRHLEPQHRQRAVAFSYYLVSPLVLISLPMLGLAVCTVIAQERQSNPIRILLPITAIFALLAFAVFVVWVVRFLATLIDTTSASVGRVLWACVVMPAGWLVCAVFALLFVPWCVGVARLMIEALR